MKKVLVIGGGAAGMMAAVFAARGGREVHVFEKNEKLGKKLFITGKGRCNITNAGDMDTLFSSVVSNPKFLYSAFYGFTNEQTITFFEELGVPVKIERGNRVFPVSDHSSDVIGALSREMNRLGVEVHLHAEVEKILTDRENPELIRGIRLKNGKEVAGDACIVATGGISYPSTGSTGDGLRFAEELGLKVTELFPALVPMEVKEWYAKELRLCIDLKPALTQEQLDQRILRDFEENRNKQFKNSVDRLFPAKLKPIMIELSGISPEKKVNEISKEDRIRFVKLIKEFPMTLTGLRSYKEAIITKGGVSVKEIDPGTMESKKIKGLYFIGEVLDLDALTKALREEHRV